MKRRIWEIISALAGFGAIVLVAAPALAHQSGQGMGMMGQGMMGPGMMLPQEPQADADGDEGMRHQPPGPGYGYGYRPGMMQGMGPGYGYGPGTMGPGMMGYGYGPGMMQGMGPGMMRPGMGYGPGPGMMGPGMMGYGYGPGMMRPGMMGPGYGYGPNMGYGPCWQRRASLDKDLEPDDVKARMERWLEMQGNDRLKLGKVEAVDENTITAEIVTVDDSLVRKLAVDRHTGWTRPAE